MSLNNDNFEKSKTRTMGLIFDCPMPPHLESCPFREIRKLPIEERVKIINNMTEQQINDILGIHDKCLSEREKGMRGR